MAQVAPLQLQGAPQRARVCVFASSSQQTPSAFLAAAARLGMLLARGGHVCVNGGGRSGGMGALNSAVAAGGGEIVGVIHSRWVVDEVEFAVETAGGKGSRMLVFDGDDLAARKRGLRDACDGIIVLPGGPGTWDELFEIVALRQLGMSSLPICLVNVDGFYDGFIMQLARAQADAVVKVAPDQLLPVFKTVDEALEWTLRQVTHGPCAELARAAEASRVSYRDGAGHGAAAALAAARSAVPKLAGAHAAIGASLALGVVLGAALARAAATR